jgi:phage host-nuclease inhibitor protein Gam
MQRTATEMLNELRKTHTKLETELRDVLVDFQNYGVAEAATLAKKLRKLATEMENFDKAYIECLEANG